MLFQSELAREGRCGEVALKVACVLYTRGYESGPVR